MAHNEKGATAIYVAIVMFVLLMFTALAIDVNHLYGVRNELQNAADAGALAGAGRLFNSAGQLDVPAAIAEGGRITSVNRTGNKAVEEYTVQTGHWSFTNREFTPNDNTTQATWHERPFSELDLDTNFINAVRVLARRSDTPSFFARIFGKDQFLVSNDAVAYIGFAGTLYPEEIDRPIAICKDAIMKDGRYSCNMGRMLNSGGNVDTAMTAMWTNYSQDPCATANNSDMKAITDDCSAGNPVSLAFGEGIGSQNGVQDNILGNITDCWEAATDTDGDGIPDTYWPLLLPVIECGVDNTCSPLVGAVLVNVVWIQYKNDPITQMDDIPTTMEHPDPDKGNWSCPSTETLEERFGCWKDFVDHFELQNVSGPPVTDEDYQEMYQQKNIFFLPACTVHEPAGLSGGENFGILAKIPRLVE